MATIAIVQIEGHHNEESFESTHPIDMDDHELVNAYVKEFTEAYKENRQSAKLSFFYCGCGCCKE